MSTTIEQLEIEIQSDATSASGGIDALSDSLRRLREAIAPVSKGGMGLGTLTTSLKKFSDGISSLSGISVAKEQVQGLADALKPLESVQKSGFNSLATGLDKLSKVAPNLDKITDSIKNCDLDGFATQCDRVATAVRPLADEMQKVANGFSAFPAKIQKLITNNGKLTTSNNGLSTSYANLAAKVGVAFVALKKIGRTIAGWITEGNTYIESLNLFTVSLGEYAEEATNYANQVAEVMGIDPADWMRNQGVFMTLADGFGIVSDRAYTMSKNLTQLVYDISSFRNLSVEEAFTKVQSGFAGELEPLRAIGYDLSVAKLQEEALALGIEKKVTAMTQAEKAELRYYAIMTQVTNSHGDMARTLEAPANQLRILNAQVTQCARSLGNIFIPALNAVLPYAIAAFQVLRALADVIATLVGFVLPEIDYSSLENTAGGVGDISDSLGDATDEAKKLKNALLGIDELNVISPQEDSGSGSGIAGAGGLGFELPTYDFIGEATQGRVAELVNKIKEWLGLNQEIDSWADLFKTRLGKILSLVGAIGAGFAAWKISKGLLTAIDSLKKLSTVNISGGLMGLGLAAFLGDLEKFRDAIEDGDTIGMISSFTGMLGDAFIALGNVKIGGALKVIQGVTEIVSSVKDIAENGVNWDNAKTAIDGLTDIAIGIGVLTGHLKLAGVAVAIQGLTTVITELGENWDAIKEGDWSGVDKVTLIIGGLEMLGGLAVALDVFSKLKSVIGIGKAAESVTTVATATQTLDTTVSTSLSPKLSSLAKNLGLGLVVVVEVAAAALLITGAIALLGWELEQVGIAWQPVIDNGGTVAIAMGVGTGILAVIGVATAALGTLGGAMCGQIAIGIAILAELGVAVGLFIIEIWAIGKGLDEIGKAWQPVLDNGETIATGIGLGTALLVGIGVVTAALGVATVASAGLLPLAIGLGTALLVELAVATVLFIESLVAVAEALGIDLAPVLEDLNGKLPGLTTDMSDFVDFMCAFAGEVVRYTGASAVSGLSATIDTIIGWFTQDPIEKMSNDVDNIAGQAKDLNEKLRIAVPELKTAVELLGEYVDFVDKLGVVAGSSGTVNLSEGLKTNLKTVGENIVTGFNDGVKNKYSLVQTTMTNWGKDALKWFNNSSYGGVNKEKFATYANDIINGFKDKISSSSGNTKSGITSWATNIKTWFTSSSYGGINKETFGKYATDIVNGFKNGIVGQSESAKSGMTTWANNTKKYFTDIVSYSAFYDIAEDVVEGFNDGINAFYKDTRYYMRKWAADARDAYKAELDSNSPSKVFMRIGQDTVLGYNLGIQNYGDTTLGIVSKWADSFTNVAPKMKLAVDTSALKYYSGETYAKTISANVTSNSNISAVGFKEAMEEFYKEYIEPTLVEMATDVKRQADKDEQTVVQIGNRTITDAVTTQQKANGFKFVTT